MSRRSARFSSASVRRQADLRQAGYTLIGSLRDPADVEGYPYAVPTKPEDIDDPSGFLTQTRQGKDVVFMHLIPPACAANCWNGKRWTLFRCPEGDRVAVALRAGGPGPRDRLRRVGERPGPARPGLELLASTATTPGRKTCWAKPRWPTSLTASTGPPT